MNCDDTFLQLMTTGFPDLDSLIGGFFPGDLVLLGSAEETSRSAFASNVALYAAQHHEAAAIFSYETTTERVLHRLTSTLTSIPFWDIIRGNLTKRDQFNIIHSGYNPVWSRLYVVGSADLTVREIQNSVEQVSKDRTRYGHKPLSLVVVDPLQLMVPAMGASEKLRSRRLAETIIQLKSMARNLRVSVLLVSELDRSIKERHCKQPELSDLEVREIANTYADKILLLHHDEDLASGSNQALAEIVVVHQRSGPIGKIRLGWKSDCNLFYSLPERSTSPNR